jgi:hexosaminidase
MRLGEGSRITARDEKLVPLARILAEEILRATGRRLPTLQGVARDGDIALGLDHALPGEEYTLAVRKRATIRGGKYEAVAQGTVTLLQALESEGGKVSVPCLTVRDRQRLPYCGAMLDVARKPYSLATLEQCVRVCRFYKIRYLHLHLSDENAWTFPSTAFPRLGSQNFAWAGGDRPAVYDLAGLKRLAAFADARGVTLVPELEVPGHSGQLRGTLPDVFGYRDAAGKTVSPGVINMVREEAYRALDTLVGEMCDVFRSSPYFHIGCDEASPAGIEKLPEVRAFVEKHRLATADAVFNHFVNRMQAIVTNSTVTIPRGRVY